MARSKGGLADALCCLPVCWRLEPRTCTRSQPSLALVWVILCACREGNSLLAGSQHSW